jgi:hypothetical protein
MEQSTVNKTIKDLSPAIREPNGILSLLACKCPRCRRGKMFVNDNPWNLKQTMKMNEACPVCDQPFNPEVGFYFGSSYISYTLTVALSAATFVAFWVFIGFPFSGHHIFYWLIGNAILLIGMQPCLMRVSRTGWLAFFVRHNADWAIRLPVKPERTNKDQENNW